MTPDGVYEIIINDDSSVTVNKKINHRMAKEWIRYVTGERQLGLECLKGLDALFELYGDKE